MSSAKDGEKSTESWKHSTKDGLHCPPVQSDTRRVRLSEPTSEHLLDKALRIAVHAHAGHVDRAGKPYLLHVLQVVGGCGDDLMAATVAALHDVVEDSTFTLRDLKDQGFPAQVVEAVDALTRREGEAQTIID